jgi:hypothetical protein
MKEDTSTLLSGLVLEVVRPSDVATLIAASKVEEFELGAKIEVFVSNDLIELCSQCPAISTHVAHTIRDWSITDEAFCQEHWNQKRRNHE